jgi:hypothetical protein
LDYLETADSPDAQDPGLRETTAPYGEYGVEWMEIAIRHLTAPAPAAWQPAEFAETVDADQWATNLQALLFDFMADRRRQTNTPYSKSYMVYQELGSFLQQQLTTPEAKAGPKRVPRGRSRSKRHGSPARDIPSSSLVPRRASLDRFLAEQMGFLSAKPYRLGVVTELLPAYLHFLARVGAIHPIQMDDALAELDMLARDALRALQSYGGDPHLAKAVDEAWSQQTLLALGDDPALAEARAMPPAAPLPPPARDRRPGSLQTFSFKVTYLRDPEVWRVIEIAEHQTLDDLHHAIQEAVGFGGDHLYSFFMSNRAWDRATEYASPQADGSSATKVKVGDLRLRMKQRFLYLFDYGDEHRFEVQLVALNPDAPEDRYPKLVESQGEDPSQYESWD